MSMVKECGKESLNIANIYRYIRFKSKFYKEHPDYFDADGLLIFVGPQGSGKTLSAVNYVYKLLEKYPKAKICTNLLLTDFPIVTYEEFITDYTEKIEELKKKGLNDEQIKTLYFKLYVNKNRVFPFVDNDDFLKYRNGEAGIIYLVDEIQLYLNSLESKNVNLDVITQISQQRKQRKHIVATSQVFGRMAKPLREQFSNVVMCKNRFGFVQWNSLIDRDSLETESSSDTQITGTVKKRFIWFHNPDIMYKRYDTYYVIEKGKFVAGEKQLKEGIYHDNRSELSTSS